MMFVTCFKKEEPPVATIQIVEEDDTKSIQSHLKINTHMNGQRNLNNLSDDYTKSKLKTLRSLVCCGCWAHSSIAPSADVLEIQRDFRSPRVGRITESACSSSNNGQTRFSELRESDISKNTLLYEKNSEKKLPRSPEKPNVSHFESIYSISDKIDNVNKQNISNSDAQLFSRNTLNTQYCNTDANEVNSCGSRHSVYSQKSMMHSDDNVLENIDSTSRSQRRSQNDLPQVHKQDITNSLKFTVGPVLHKTVSEVDNIEREITSVMSVHLSKHRSDGDLKMGSDAIQTLTKETYKSLSAGKIFPNNNLCSQVKNRISRTAAPKEPIVCNTDYDLLIDKVTIKENTWFNNINQTCESDDNNSNKSFNSKLSISSNRLSFGRSLSVESDDYIQEAKTESNARSNVDLYSQTLPIVYNDRCSMNSFDNKQELNKIDKSDRILCSDENNNEENEPKVRILKDFVYSTHNLEQSDSAQTFETVKQPNSMSTLIAQNVLIINQEKSYADENNSNLKCTNNEVHHENMSNNVNVTEELKTIKSEIFTSQGFSENETNYDVACKTKESMTQRMPFEFENFKLGNEISHGANFNESHKIQNERCKGEFVKNMSTNDEDTKSNETLANPDNELLKHYNILGESSEEDDRGCSESSKKTMRKRKNLRFKSNSIDENSLHELYDTVIDSKFVNSRFLSRLPCYNTSNGFRNEGTAQKSQIPRSQPSSPYKRRLSDSSHSTVHRSDLENNNEANTSNNVQDTGLSNPNTTPKKSPNRTPTRLPKSINSYASNSSSNKQLNGIKPLTTTSTTTNNLNKTPIKTQRLYPESLPPFEKPKEALSRVLSQMESSEWETMMQGLQGIVRLSRHHTKLLLSGHVHFCATQVSKQVRSLRSQVARAACQTAAEMFTILGRHLEPELEELSKCLLSRTADTNKFLRADSNEALVAMITHIQPIKTIPVILSRGAKHQNAIVRSASCHLLLKIVELYSPENFLSMPHDIRNSTLIAAAKFLLEGSLETRTAAKELFVLLSQDPKAFGIIREVVSHQLLTSCNKVLVPIFKK